MPVNTTVVEAVKLASPEILFARLDPPPQALTTVLCRAAESGAPPAAAQAFTSSKPPSHEAPHDPLATDAASAATMPDDVDKTSPPARHSAKPAPTPMALAIQKFRLDAPLRLPPAIREALVQVIDTLNHEGATAAACQVGEGLFIPFVEFERRNIEPSRALRALIEVQMLVHPKSAPSPAVTRDVGGTAMVGLLLNSRFVTRLDPDMVDPADAGGN